MKFIQISMPILSILVGIKILATKNISQGNAAMGGGSINIGNWAYLLGGIFLGLGIFLLYRISVFKK